MNEVRLSTEALVAGSGWSKCLVLWAFLVDTFEECQLGSSSWPGGNGLDVTRHTSKDVGLFQSSKNP